MAAFTFKANEKSVSVYSEGSEPIPGLKLKGTFLGLLLVQEPFQAVGVLNAYQGTLNFTEQSSFETEDGAKITILTIEAS